MTEILRIVDQYDRAMNGEAWHGDNVWTTLREVHVEQAFQRTLPNAHTIWELVAHMTFWETQVYRRLKKLPDLNEDTLNFPAMPAARAENWNEAMAELRRSNDDFRTALLALEDSQLDNPLSAPGKTVYVEVHGVIQHHLYHAGQIAILRKISTDSKVVTGL